MVRRLFTNLGMLQVFISGLLVIVIMFVSTLFIYRNLISGIYEKVSENNGLVVQSIVQSLDNSFRTINNIIYTIHRLPPYDSLALTADNHVQMLKVQELVQNLETLISTVDYIEEVVVFFDSSNLAVTSKGTSSFDLLFNTKYNHASYNADYWRAYAKAQHPFKLFSAEEYTIYSETNRQTRTENLIMAVAGNKMSASSKQIIIMINSDALMKHVNQQPMIPGATLTMLDQDRSIVYSTGKQLDIVDILNEATLSANADTSLTKENFEYNFYYSDYNDYTYIEKVPYRFQNLGTVEKANYMIMLLACVSAIVVAVSTSLYMHRPVRKIIRQLGGGNSKGDDFRKIHSGIVKLQSENDTYRKQISSYDAEQFRYIFLRVLHGQLHHEEHDFQMQKYYTRFFSEKYFVMVKFELDVSDEGTVSVKTVEELASVLQEGMSQLQLSGTVIYDHTAYIALIGMTAPEDKDVWLRRARQSLAGLGKHELNGYSCRGCVSKVYISELENCQHAYAEVNNASLHRQVNEGDILLDAESVRLVWNAYLPFERLEKLSNYILTGKADEGIAIIKQTMQENIARNVHYYQLEHIAKTIFFYLNNIAGGLGNAPQQLYELEHEFLQQLDSRSNGAAIENALVKVAQHLSRLSKTEPKNKLNPVYIAQYIELNYMKDLYLDHIAEVMETSPKYFSYFFKKSFGVNYVEYLNKVRLTHARELLKDTNDSITEIAEKTGYSTLSSFTITFKKYMGISPTDFRKQIDL